MACGAALDPASRTAESPVASTALPEDQTRVLTVLFSDLSGSVATVHGLGPEEAVGRINEALEVMARVVSRHEGRVDRFRGDGLLAVFGDRRAHEDDPIRAVSAAIEIRDELRGRGFETTAGVNTGEVYLGRIGSEQHREFTTMGPVINLGARFQSAAAPGEILVGGTTWRSARRAFEFEPRVIDVKGVPQPVRVYAALERLPHPELARGFEGADAALTGRDREFARLERTFAETMAGEGSIVTLVGEAGVGKSRLVAELEHRTATAEGGAETLWLEGRCLESTMATAYHPFIDLLRGYLGKRHIETVVAELAERGDLMRHRLVDIEPLLRRLLSDTNGSDGGILRDAPPQQIQAQTFAAIRDLLLALARQRSIVIVIEDLHWADSLSVDLVSFLLPALHSAPLLVLCTYRPDPHHKCRHLAAIAAEKAEGRHVPIELRELDREDSRRLLSSLLDDETPLATIEREVLAKAQGNPLFLEEIVRSLMESGELVRESGGWRMTTDTARIVVPETVQSIVTSRVDLLEDELRRVLQAASVIGRVFPRGLVAAVLGSDVGLERALWQLEQLGLVYLDRVVPQEEYSFKHVFARDTIYRSLLKDRRAELHAAVVRAIERQHGDRLDEQVDRLAYHYDRAEIPEKAIEYLIAAGERAAEAFSNDQAIESLHRARERLDGLPAGVDLETWARGLRIRIAERLGDVFELVGRHEEGEASFQQGLAWVADGEPFVRARLLRKLAASRQLQRESEAAIEALEAALDAVGRDPAGDVPVWWRERVENELVRYGVLYFTGALGELEARFESTREEIERHATPLQRGRLYQYLAMVRFRKERYVLSEATVEISRAAYEAIEEGGNLSEVAYARFGYGFSLMWAGRLEEADAELAAAFALGERIGDVTVQTRCATYLALTARKRGDVRGARRWAERAIDLAAAGGMVEYTASGEAQTAWAAWREGDLAEAERRADRAYELWNQLGGPYLVLAWMPVWPLLGVAWRGGRLDDAIDRARFLLDPERQPMHADVEAPLEAAVAAFDRGDHELARTRLAEAVELARDPGYL